MIYSIPVLHLLEYYVFGNFVSWFCMFRFRMFNICVLHFIVGCSEIFLSDCWWSNSFDLVETILFSHGTDMWTFCWRPNRKIQSRFQVLNICVLRFISQIFCLYMGREVTHLHCNKHKNLGAVWTHCICLKNTLSKLKLRWIIDNQLKDIKMFTATRCNWGISSNRIDCFIWFIKEFNCWHQHLCKWSVEQLRFNIETR